MKQKPCEKVWNVTTGWAISERLWMFSDSLTFSRPWNQRCHSSLFCFCGKLFLVNIFLHSWWKPLIYGTRMEEYKKLEKKESIRDRIMLLQSSCLLPLYFNEQNLAIVFESFMWLLNIHVLHDHRFGFSLAACLVREVLSCACTIQLLTLTLPNGWTKPENRQAAELHPSYCIHPAPTATSCLTCRVLPRCGIVELRPLNVTTHTYIYEKQINMPKFSSHVE